MEGIQQEKGGEEMIAYSILAALVFLVAFVHGLEGKRVA